MTKWQIVYTSKHFIYEDRYDITTNIVDAIKLEMENKARNNVERYVGDFYKLFNVGFCLKTTVEEE